MSKLLLSKFITKPELQLFYLMKTGLRKVSKNFKLKVFNGISTLPVWHITYTLRVLMQTMGIITTTARPAAVHIIHTWRTAKCLYKQDFYIILFFSFLFQKALKVLKSFFERLSYKDLKKYFQSLFNEKELLFEISDHFLNCLIRQTYILLHLSSS